MSAWLMNVFWGFNCFYCSTCSLFKRAGCRKDGAVYKHPLWTPRNSSFLKNMLSNHIQSFTPLINREQSNKARTRQSSRLIRYGHGRSILSILYHLVCFSARLWDWFCFEWRPLLSVFLNIHNDIEDACMRAMTPTFHQIHVQSVSDLISP